MAYYILTDSLGEPVSSKPYRTKWDAEKAAMSDSKLHGYTAKKVYKYNLKPKNKYIY